MELRKPPEKGGFFVGGPSAARRVQVQATETEVGRWEWGVIE